MRPNCPLCGANPTKSRPAKVAEFLQKHAGVQEKITSALYCNYCDFVWHELGLKDEEIDLLYKDYRGMKYNETRMALEPEYSAVARDFSNLNSAHYRERSGELDALFRNKKSRINRTLDLGGDAMFNKWIFPGAINDFSDLSHGESLSGDSNEYDVVFCFHLLEHVNNPIEILKKAWQSVGKKGILITAVPREFNPPLNREFDLIEGYESALFNMHEHMNFYSERSIEVLADRSQVPLIGSRLLLWNGLISFFSHDPSWIDSDSLDKYEFRRLQNMINDQFHEMRINYKNQRKRTWIKK